MTKKSTLQKRLEQKASQTVMRLMADERTRPVVARAMQTYMDGRQRFEDIRETTAAGLGLATRGEINAVRGRLRRLGKRVGEIEQRFTAVTERLDALDH